MFDEVKELALNHSRRVLTRAIELKKQLISPRVFSKEYKSGWELELWNKLKEVLDENILLLGKDSGLHGDLDSKWVCICDLFDGSKNFFTDMKFYAYSLALARDNELVFSIVIDLENNDVYLAEKDKGAFLNDVSLSTLSSRYVDSYDLAIDNVPVSREFYMGCAALQFCYIAKGCFRFLIGKTCNIDIAAGYLIAKEAGVKVLDLSLIHI